MESIVQNAIHKANLKNMEEEKEKIEKRNLKIASGKMERKQVDTDEELRRIVEGIKTSIKTIEMKCREWLRKIS